MLNRKSLGWFLALTFLPAWILFLAPLTLTHLDVKTKALATQGLWALAMWTPGIAAILTTLFVERNPFHTLRLNTLGAKRFYLWAWILPIGFVILGGLTGWITGLAKLDWQFSAIREALAAAPSGQNPPVEVLLVAQVGFAFTLAPVINMLFTVGEELGWRGFLLERLLPLGQWQAILISGVIWGVWHAPVIAQGHNYPGYPILGMGMMVVFCVLLGTVLAWLALNTRSPWVAALGHGTVNAVAGLPILFFAKGFDMALTGSLASPTAWVGMGLFILWLTWSKRLPVPLASAK